jgi:hypothetical protein
LHIRRRFLLCALCADGLLKGIKMTQEQQALITALTARITALENK